MHSPFDLVLIPAETVYLSETLCQQACCKHLAPLIELFLALLVVKKVALPLPISVLLSCMAYGYVD